MKIASLVNDAYSSSNSASNQILPLNPFLSSSQLSLNELRTSTLQSHSQTSSAFLPQSSPSYQTTSNLNFLTSPSRVLVTESLLPTSEFQRRDPPSENYTSFQLLQHTKTQPPWSELPPHVTVASKPLPSLTAITAINSHPITARSFHLNTHKRTMSDQYVSTNTMKFVPQSESQFMTPSLLANRIPSLNLNAHQVSPGSGGEYPVLDFSRNSNNNSNNVFNDQAANDKVFGFRQQQLPMVPKVVGGVGAIGLRSRHRRTQSESSTLDLIGFDDGMKKRHVCHVEG
ncbi:hypothetical protein HK096_009541, partial [Nowakowskiella sp. JEL0078]